MNRKIILVALILLIFGASCNKQSTSVASNDQQSASVEFKTIAVDDFVKHTRAASDVEGLRYTIRLTYPSQCENKAVLETLQREFTSHVLGKKYASLTPEAAVKACINDWKKEYVDDTKEFPLIYEFICSDTILFINNALLQMKEYRYEQRGGAHGFGGSSSHLFNLQTGNEYSRNDIFKPDTADYIRWAIIDAVRNYLGIEDGEDSPIFNEDVWTEDTNFAITQKGILLTYDNQLGGEWIQDPIAIPYTRIMANLREGTPVWELAKEAVMNTLNDNSRALLAKEGIGIGSSLEDLLKSYPKCKIEIYYTDMGSLEYSNLDEMLKGYGEDWYSAYNDWAIFTPLKPNGKEAEISFYISFKDLDNRDKYKKESKVWMISD